ncbi:MAG: hypothetical protein HY619_00965 [Thaumarchaeota archaeon]|nr:hypothetical protein [Nitrososphaerota archaeon]
MAKHESKLVSIEKRLDELEETMEILGDRKTMRSIERGLNDLRAGRYKRYDTVDALLEGVASQR